ncbi:MAG: DUF4956 domain-containing protein [Deltaproteobacteria bacterium]|nr:DUF4956 domain-containing protein [Deltaproteobacteria bacterium]
MIEFKYKLIFKLLGTLIGGGLLAFFVKLLYQRFSNSISNRENFSSIFIPLTISTALVISVVKSSLALSLGLVGALSIVRFRAAIKDPEELVYLFFCIAIGLTLGADRWREAFAGVFVFTLFIISIHYLGVFGKNCYYNLLLTITGKKAAFFDKDKTKIDDIMNEVVGRYQIQRFECDDGQVQFRATIIPESERDLTIIMDTLQKKLPKCQISYVNLHNLL